MTGKLKYPFIILLLTVFFITGCGGGSGGAASVITEPPEDNTDQTQNLDFDVDLYIWTDEDNIVNQSPLKNSLRSQIRVQLYENGSSFPFVDKLLNNNRLILSSLDKVPQIMLITHKNGDLSRIETPYYLDDSLEVFSNAALKGRIIFDLSSQEVQSTDICFYREIWGSDYVVRNVYTGLKENRDIIYKDMAQSKKRTINKINNNTVQMVKNRIDKEFSFLISRDTQSLMNNINNGNQIYDDIDLEIADIDILDNIFVIGNIDEINTDFLLPETPSGLIYSELKYNSVKIQWNYQQDLKYSLYDENDILLKDNIVSDHVYLNDLEQEKNYLLILKSENQFGFSEPAIIQFKTPEMVDSTKILKSITVNPLKTTIYTNRTFDLKKLDYIAEFEDETTYKVNNILFTKMSGEGTLDDHIFYSPKDTGETVLRAMYKKNGIFKYSYFKVYYHERIRILTSIELSHHEYVIKTKDILDLSDITLSLYYDDGVVKELSDFEFIIESGEGEIIDKIFYPADKAQEVLLKVDYEDDGEIFSDNIRIVVKKSLTALYCDRNEIFININEDFDLSSNTYVAQYDHSITSEVSVKDFYITEGNGIITDTIFSAPDHIGITRFRADYTEDDITVNTFFTVQYGKTLTNIVLSEQEILMETNTEFDLNNIIITAEFDDNTSNIVNDIEWQKISGRGDLSGKTFYSLGFPGESILRCFYEFEGVQKSKDIIFKFDNKPQRPTGLAIIDLWSDGVKIEWNYSGTNLKFQVFVDDVLKIDSLNTNSASISGLQRGYSYNIKVRSVNDIGESEFSEVLRVVMIPSKPEGMELIDVTSSSFKFKWDKISTAEKYRIYLDNTLKNSSIEDNFYEFKNLIPGNVYRVKLTAKNSSGISPFSDDLVITTLTQAPSNLRITDVTKTGFRFSWAQVNSADAYNVYLDSQLVSENLVSNFDIFSDLESGNEYFVKVSAVKDGVEGDISESIKVILPPVSPDNLQISALTVSSLTVTWNGSNGATYYRLYKNGIFYGVNTDNTYMQVTGLNSGTEYSFKVKAFNNSGESEYSIPVFVKTPPERVSVVYTVDVGTTSFNIFWNAVTGVDYYKVYIDDVLVGDNVQNTHLLVTGRQPDTNYRINVVAVNSGGESQASPTHTVETEL